MWKQVASFDERVDRSFDRWRGRPGPDALATVASILGDRGLLWFLIGVAGWVAGGRRRAHALSAVAFTGTVVPVANLMVKTLVDRTRPPSPARAPGLRSPTSASFPSGHALAAWCAATMLAEDDPAAPLYFAAAGTVSVSRIHLRHHHASDVVAGASLGLVLGLVGRKVTDRVRARGMARAGARLDQE